MAGILTVAAKEVVVGDEVFNRLAFHPSAQWVRVTAVLPSGTGSVIIRTFSWDTWKHPEEAIGVRRFPVPC